MAEDVRRRAFEPFYTTKGAGGTGLGLAMVRKVVEAHGGAIGVETAPGRGTTFRLRFPAGAAPTGPPPWTQAAVEGVAPDAVPPARIVVVDDQPDVLDTVGMLLRRDGHDVRAFRDPRAAVDAVLAERPDVLLTDLGMPGLSGWDVAREARAAVARPAGGPAHRVGPGRHRRPAARARRAAGPGQAGGAAGAARRPWPGPCARRPRRRRWTSCWWTTPPPSPPSWGCCSGRAGTGCAASSGPRAAVEALAGEAPVDLVILDLNLPDGPSVDVLRAARARPRAPAVCVVSGSDPGAMETEVPGADLYVEKAYVPEQLERIYAAAAPGGRRPPDRPGGPGRAAYRVAGTVRPRYACRHGQAEGAPPAAERGPGGRAPPAALPMPVFLAFLRRLHDGPPQHAAAVRVALAVWQGAVDRADVAQAREAVAMVRAELDRLLASLTELQETGRRWSGVRAPTPAALADAERAAADWEAGRRRAPE